MPEIRFYQTGQKLCMNPQKMCTQPGKLTRITGQFPQEKQKAGVHVYTIWMQATDYTPPAHLLSPKKNRHFTSVTVSVMPTIHRTYNNNNNVYIHK